MIAADTSAQKTPFRASFWQVLCHIDEIITLPAHRPLKDDGTAQIIGEI